MKKISSVNKSVFKVSNISRLTRKFSDLTKIKKDFITNWQMQSNQFKDGFDFDYKVSSYRINDSNHYLFNIELITKSKPYKIPAILYCTLDVSGSMGSSLQDTSKNIDNEAGKFSRLDLVKHCMNTVVNSLTDDDVLSLGVFSNNFSEVCKLQKMNNIGKVRCLEAIEKLSPNGSTNLWKGLKDSSDSIFEFTNLKGKNIFNLCLTDGEPNMNPPRGIEYEFNKLIDSNLTMGKYYQLDTFGFNGGYNNIFDSELLLQISKRTAGGFNFISDFSTCGSVFVNSLTNYMVTAKQNVTVDDLTVKNCKASVLNLNSENSIGSILWNQPRNIFVSSEINNPKDFFISLNILGKEIRLDLNNYSNEPDNQTVKFIALELIKKELKNYNVKNAELELENLRKILKSNHFLYNDFYHSDTYKGQVGKALLNTEFFNSWGIPYLKNFVRSHELNVCSNFKDESLQIYSSDYSAKIKEEIENIFCNIEPPKPSCSDTYFSGNFRSSCYNSSGPCVDGFGKIKLVDGSIKLVKDIKVGDKVETKNGFSKVKFVVKTIIEGGKLSMADFNDMKITPYHPIFIDNTWKFPIDVMNCKLIDCEAIYSFVLENDHRMIINGNEIITLGHGYQEGILKHDLYGTQKIVSLLESKDTDKSGYIIVKEFKIKRDEKMNVMSF